MKTKFTILFTVLCSAFATTVVFGQTTYVWTNQYQAHLVFNGGDMNQATNWSPNGVPNPMTGPDANGVCGDLMQFAGLTTGPASVTEDGGSLGGGGGQSHPYGARIELTTNQTASVTIFSPVSISGGLRMNWFTIDPGAGPLIYGDHSGNILDTVCGEVNGQIFGFTNNSTTACQITESPRWRCGGAGNHPMVFAGTGDWIVNNHLRSTASSSLQVMMEGSGTFTWTGTNDGPESVDWFDKLGNPTRFDSGTTILKSSDLLNADAGSPNIVNNGTLLKFDYTPAPGIITTPDSIAGAISGAGPIEVHAGTVTFAGASTFTGNINLTGGELIAGSPENVGVSGPLGQGGIISFNGGTLGWNLANAFDYSPRFDTNAGQVYKLDTGASSPILTAGLTSSGGTLNKTGGGSITLAGTNTYSGLTTVSGGKLVFQGPKTGTGNITVADGATLGVFDTGTPVTPATLTLGTNAGCTLEFNNVTNTTTAPLAAGTLSSAGTVTININSGSFTAIGQSFPLLSWTSGSAPAVALGTVSGAAGYLSTNGNQIQFNVILVASAWTGTSSGNWSDPNNWTMPYSDSQPARFDDTAPGTTSVTVDIQVHPASVTVFNNTKTYSIASSGVDNIAGGTGLTKSGSGALTLSGGANTYTGVTTVGGGTVVSSALANGGTASDIGAASSANTNIVLSGGGRLQYNGVGVTIDRSFSVGQGGGTIDNEGSGALVFSNPGPIAMSGNGPRTLILTGPNTYGDTLYGAIVNHPAGTALEKDGTGTWILAGTNTYAGGTSLQGGTLQIGASGPNATIGSGNISTATGTTIDFERTGTLLVPGAISGGCAVTSGGSGTVILANNNTYTGGTTINAGTLQLGNGGGGGSVNGVGLIAVNNNSTLAFNTSGSFAYGSGANGVISGTGNVSVQGGGYIKAIGANTYTGWTLIGANTIFQPYEGQDGGLASFAVTNNGTLRLVRQDATITYAGNIVGSGKLQIGANNPLVGVITLTGTNTYTGGTFIGGNQLVLGDGVTPVSGAIAGNVQFVNNFTLTQDNQRILTFNRPDDFTFAGTITTNFTSMQTNLGIVQQNGTGTVTLTGNNTYGSGTIVNAGALVIGNGGPTGSVGLGPINLASGNSLVINRTGSLSIPGAITGAGGVRLIGNATVTLSSAGNTYSGPTTVSNGTLIVTSLGGQLDVAGGTVIVRDIATAANLNVTGNMNIGSGTVVATLNKAAAQSNTTYSVSGTVNYTGGTLKLLTAGPALTVGDKFFIFNRPVTGGAAMPVFSPGCNVSNGLAVDGSVTVLTAQPLPTITSVTVVSGTALVVSWPAAWQGGVHVQSQTNPITTGLGINWVTVPGSDAFSDYTNTINKANGTVFFRLVSP